LAHVSSGDAAFASVRKDIAVIVVAGVLSGCPKAYAQGRTWYVDCAKGDDGADGFSASAAWKSVAAINRHTFQPGDSIYFRRGTVCPGKLEPKGSGKATAAIHVDAWGTGPLPKIEAGGGQEAAFRLFDQEYWTISHLEFAGGEPYGVFISGSQGILHGIHLQDLVVHDVTGKPKNKETGLVVLAAGTEKTHFDDVVIDGVTAYHTSQWAGILVAGVAHGFTPESARNTNVVIRNCIVHDVAGDGIVLFQVNNGRIENSVAWLTGMQATQSIGTPNAIWTWMCRHCTVANSEAFLTDSPGVDGGAFDIDYGNADNVVVGNYGHDTQGYCVAVFGAGWITTNSKVLNNVCADNGLSPRLAILQGAVYLATWNQGKIEGLEISGNRILWNPKVSTAAIVNVADFVGKGSFHKNTIHSCSPVLVRNNQSLVLEENSFQGCAEQHKPLTRNWCLTAFVTANDGDHDSRGQVALLASVHREFPTLKIRIIVVGASGVNENLRFDWNTGDLFPQAGDRAGQLPAVFLTDESGKEGWRHIGLTHPGELGLALRSFIGEPQFAQLRPDE
jgi:hypothetical protein